MAGRSCSCSPGCAAGYRIAGSHEYVTRLKLPGEHPYEGKGLDVIEKVEPTGMIKLIAPDLLQSELAVPAEVITRPST